MIRDLGPYAKRVVMVVVAGASISFLAGCYDREYYSQSDTVTLGVGDAVATNAAVQTIDPWPPHAKDTDIDLEGPRAAVAVERYQTNTSLKPKGLPNSTEIYAGGGNGAAVSQ